MDERRTEEPLINPFDFSNPVRSLDILAGRKKEMDDALYYLGQDPGATSYSVALIGERASGKTSLLNALSEKGRDMGYLCAHVALDETIMSSELSFFREVFESILHEGASHGMFGGEAGAKYLRFVEQVEFLNLDQVPGEEPLAFGRLYATAQREGRDLALSRTRLKSDFRVVIEEAETCGMKGLFLLIDECDLLGQDRGLLQALRNLLMDLSGLKLVMAGTEAMFPAMEDVFSPVPRQFVRVNVGNFRGPFDTYRAIDARLESKDLAWARPEMSVAMNIHRVTRGNPYQVMLLSHYAFKHTIDIENRSRLSLTAVALDDVARQLEEQNPGLQEAFRRVRALSQREAAILDRAITLDGVDFRCFGLANTEFAIEPDLEEVEGHAETVRREIKKIEHTGLVEIVDDTIQVPAEDYERLYIRYFVRGSGEPIVLPELDDPRKVLAKNTSDLLAQEVIAAFHVTEPCQVVNHAWDGANVSADMPLAESALPLSDYEARLEVPLDIGGSEWSAAIWMPALDKTAECLDLVASVCAQARIRVAHNGVRLGAPRIEVIQSEEVEEMRGQYAIENDPTFAAISELQQLFLFGDGSNRDEILRQSAQQALEEIRKSGVPEGIDRLATTYLSNLAFMLLSVGTVDDYDYVVQLIPTDANLPLVATTQALRWAGAGQLGRAKELLEVAESSLDPAESRFGDVFMYGPQLFAQGRAVPKWNEIVNGELIDVIKVYQASLEVLADDGDVGAHLKSRFADLDWVLNSLIAN